nr:hypothetical protein [Tanacetum cinerariifolium]
AFTTSSTIPLIYIQQLWDIVRYDKTVWCYKCQLDEQWFDLTKDALRDALQITPVNDNNAFSSPPTPDALINFVNDLKRIWEEFTQSIHTFIEDKNNLAQHTQRKKKATLIVIPSVRFTKLIIYYLQSKHKFHPRPDSPLHLPNEEPVLGYLKFSAKGTKRGVFGMPIPIKLITADIQGEQYYKDYLEKVAKHQRYLAGQKRSDPDSPAPKPAKAIKKSKPSTPKADLRPPPSPAKRSKPGLVTKRRKPTSSLSSVDVSVNESIPDKEPRVDDEEADIQRAVEESLKSFHDAPQGLLPPVVIREPDSEKFQPLLEVQGKGKEKRPTSASTEPSSHAESSSIYTTLGLTDSASESDEEVPHVVEIKAQDEGHAGPNPGVLTEGQAGPNPGVLTKGQARSDPSVDAEPQPQSSPVVHAGPNLEHMDLEATNENLKLTVEEQVILKEPASSTGTLSSLQHLAKYFSFGDLFFNDRPSEAENEKTTTETEAESMVSITIQQDTSAIPPMTTSVIDLTSRPDSPNVHWPLQATATKTTMATTTTTHPPPPQPQQSTTDSMLMKRIGELEQIMANLIQDNNHLEERLDSYGARLYTLENLDIAQQVSKAVDEIVTDAVDWAIQAPL